LKIKIFENWHLKLLAVMIAFLLWFYIASQKSVEFTVIAPIKYKNLPDNLCIVKDKDDLKFVKLLLYGPKNYQSSQNFVNTDVMIDLANATVGNNTFKIFSNYILIPEEFKIVNIDPPEIEITIDRKANKRVKVIPEILGDIPKNFNFSDIIITPEFADIIGPEKILRKIKELKTETVNIKDLLNSGRIEIKLEKIDPSIKIIESIDYVIVELKNAEQLKNKLSLPASESIKDKNE